MKVITNVGLTTGVQPHEEADLPAGEAEYLVRHGYAMWPKKKSKGSSKSKDTDESSDEMSASASKQ